MTEEEKSRYETAKKTIQDNLDTFPTSTKRWMMTREELTAERVNFLWDLFRPNSPYGKNAWVDLKKEKPYLFDD